MIRALLRRDPLFLLAQASALGFLSLDTWVSHQTSGTIRPWEWVPVIFGGVGCLLLIVAGAIALVWRPLAIMLAVPTFIASIVVGALGAWQHLIRLVTPGTPLIEALAGAPYEWFPPFLAPLAFCLVGGLGLSALPAEEPEGSGRVGVAPGLFVTLPLPRLRAYLLLVALGIVIAAVSATFDHAHTYMDALPMWIASAVGIFAAAAVLVYAALDAPGPEDALAAGVALVFLALTGIAGEAFHVLGDFELGMGKIVAERFVRGAPVMAPLLYVYMAMLGGIALWAPVE